MAYCSYFQAMNGRFNQQSAILQLVAQALAALTLQCFSLSQPQCSCLNQLINFQFDVLN